MDQQDEGTRRLLEVLAVMAVDGQVIDDIVAAARAAAPEVARLPAADTRQRVVALFAEGLELFSGPGVEERDFSTARSLGADRAAQHIPLGAALSALHAGRNRLTELVATRARGAGVPDGVLLAALMTFNEWMAALERHVLSGYQAAERELARSVLDLRLRVLEWLLGGSQPPPAELARAGLDLLHPYHLLVAQVAEPGDLAKACADAGGFFGRVGTGQAGLTPRLPAGDLLDGTGPVVASPPVPLHEIRGYHQVCRHALTAAGELGLRGLHRLSALAGPAALAAQPLLADLLRDSMLPRLDPAAEFHRELVHTALAYLDHGGRVDRTATALHVHPNTIRYRLTRLEELTGLSLGPPTDGAALHTLHWWWALHSWLTTPQP